MNSFRTFNTIIVSLSLYIWPLKELLIGRYVRRIIITVSLSPLWKGFIRLKCYVSEQSEHLSRGEWLVAFLQLSVWFQEMVRKDENKMCNSAAFQFSLPQTSAWAICISPLTHNRTWLKSFTARIRILWNNDTCKKSLYEIIQIMPINCFSSESMVWI